jgi:intein/homing endonuclease
MPRKTEKGVEMYKRVLGFREFIKRVEEDRLKRMDPTELERIIPYAIVLGIEDIWIEKISKVINYIPDWIQTSTRDVREAISITISSLSVSLSTVVSYRTS